MDFTEEQQRAIDLEGMNILVSAGAGSGKTAVLSERVKRKVLGGVHVNELLVLTFTNAAAAEMKERIRKKLQNTKGLEEEANLVDGSYITTFDSFALSMVKKYHTRLNITSQVQITDETIMDLKKRELLDSIFDSYYQKPSKEFLSLIENFCLKDDKDLKESLLNAYSKIELKYDKSDFLNHYFDIFTEEKQKEFVREYLDFLKEKRDVIKDLFLELGNYFDEKFLTSFEAEYHKFLNANTYQDFLDSLDIKSINAPRGSSEEGKAIKSQIVDLVKDFKTNYCIYSNEEEIWNELVSTNSNQKIIINILQEFDKLLEEIKRREELYTFNDIARMAIQVVEENPDIREELKNSFNEIMVDEYQDTSDIQEKFISLISRNNVYMVGDIKQSIYRFRNANPDIFRMKYNMYRDTDQGEKIDLLKNFRSRKEVLDDINLLFDPIMDEKIGGAQYQESHRMVFGNQSYETSGKSDQNYHMDVITYDKKELGKIRDVEEEAFIIGQDILHKIKLHFQVFDREKNTLRAADYSDFVILLDRGTNFGLYKKIFEYLQIPLTILKDESFQTEDDSFIFRNLLKFILCIKDNRIDSDFWYSFVSLSRSFLYPLEDSLIFEIKNNQKVQDTKLYQDAFTLSQMVDSMSPSQFIQKIFEITEYDSKILTTSNIYSKRVREEYFYRLAENYEKLGKTIYDFLDYLDQIYEGDYDLKFNMSEKSSNSCRIMTIHKSKGLEFPICYFAGYSSSFNLMELKERILFDNQYGLILPKVNKSYKDTILKVLLKDRVKKEEISEKIRLFYVATTRAKEKMIFVIPDIEETFEVRGMVSNTIREKYNSFLKIMESICSNILPFIHETNVEATKAYLNTKEVSSFSKGPVKELKLDDEIIKSKEVEEKHFSKESLHLVTKEEKETMDFGTEVHEILELMDFQNPTLLDSVENTMVKKEIEAFLKSDLVKDKLNLPMYKEYEFYDTEDGVSYHGIIDLLIEEKDSYIIIDYKTKNVDDEHYIEQLNGYRQFIEKKTGKKCKCYLYSILGEDYKEV